MMLRPLEICILQGAFLPVPPLLGGAVEKQWFALGKEFASRGHSVVHFSRKFPKLPNDEVIDGVNHRRIAGASAPRTTAVRKVLDLIYTLRVARVMPPSDTIITNTFWAPFVLAPLNKGRVIVDFSRMPKGQARLYPRNVSIRVPSSAVARRVREERADSKGDLWVIPNALTSPARPVAFPAKRKSLLYAGRVHPEKGLEILLEAFLRLPETLRKEWSLDIAGPWETREGGGGQVFHRELAAKYSHPSIQWLGSVHDPDTLDRLYAEAAIFCYPSIAEDGETFGSAPLEAMAWGCATIVSGLDCFLDFVRSEENGLVFNHRGASAVDSLTGALCRLMESDDLRYRLGQNALNVRQTHSLASVASLYLDQFQAFSKGAQPAPRDKIV